MRKRLILAAGVVVLLFISGPAFSQAPSDLSPAGGGVCCDHGKPQIPAGQKCLLLHQVGPGENLHLLAAYYYGDARAWRQIYLLNKKAIKNPNKILVGQILKVEVPPCWTPRFSLAEFMAIEKRRRELLARTKGEKPKEYRTRAVIESKLPVIIEEEEEEEVEEGATARERAGGPIIETPPAEEGGGEETRPSGLPPGVPPPPGME